MAKRPTKQPPKQPTKQQPKRRSTNADDYQKVPRPIAAMSKVFTDGHEIAPHHHPRDQLLYSVTGLMRVRTDLDHLPAGRDRRGDAVEP